MSINLPSPNNMCGLEGLLVTFPRDFLFYHTYPNNSSILTQRQKKSLLSPLQIFCPRANFETASITPVSSQRDGNIILVKVKPVLNHCQSKTWKDREVLFYYILIFFLFISPSLSVDIYFIIFSFFFSFLFFSLV